MNESVRAALSQRMHMYTGAPTMIKTFCEKWALSRTKSNEDCRLLVSSTRNIVDSGFENTLSAPSMLNKILQQCAKASTPSSEFAFRHPSLHETFWIQLPNKRPKQNQRLKSLVSLKGASTLITRHYAMVLIWKKAPGFSKTKFNIFIYFIRCTLQSSSANTISLWYAKNTTELIWRADTNFSLFSQVFSLTRKSVNTKLVGQ